MKGKVKIQSYKDLIVWQRGIELVVEIYGLTKKMPKSEEFALSNQMRRAAVAIPSNIAEGYMRKGLSEYIQFLRIGIASASELETQLIIINKIYPRINTEEANNLLDQILKMLWVLIAKLKGTR